MGRLHLVLATAVMVAAAIPAAAQTGRIQGVVRDVNGEPIKGAIVKAIHPEAQPRELTAIADDRGRFAIIGLRTATTWRFVAEAPGYYPAEGSSLIRAQPGAPLQFVLVKDPGPIPGALAGNIQQQLTAANALRDEGRFDEAITAYQAIQKGNEKLTVVSLVLGDVLREKARRETNATARRALLERAIAAYDVVLRDDAGNERAKLEKAAVNADLQALPR